VGGIFSHLGGQAHGGIGRLKPDGTLDTTFTSAASSVLSLALQADGRILVGGFFTFLNGQARNYLGRLNADGTLDTTFNPGANNGVYSFALQTDGKILVAGLFTTLGGQVRTNLGRLNADGTLDTSFNPGADNAVSCLALQDDGKILVGGQFNSLGGQARNHIGRLNNTGPATQSLTFDGSILTWMRGGTSPEVWRTTFEYSTDGTSWVNLTGGVRIPGGWQLAGLALPPNTTFRARGYTAAGYWNGSSWFVERVLRPPLTISDVRRFPGGQLGFNANGPAGQVVVVEISADLSNWTPLQTNALSSGSFSFTDPELAVLPSRYYRLRAEP
jgi:uncharacterized delta-60 repeat protein